ncbi:phosphatidylglycerol lysyltransferase domain-containing protein [Mangrovactinospora gilvigrisea]|nr:phosphatidylglycerol lysyltransferase domain-containing protein [Mangrovactinospora gilvigrisea]
MPSNKSDRRDATVPNDPSPAWRRRCATALIWYLRLVGAFNLVGALSYPLRERVNAHNNGNYYTPFLVTSGYVSAAFAIFFAVMLARKKRAGWIATMILLGGYSVLVIWSMYYPEYRDHLFNWLSLAITLSLLVLAVLSRREFYAKGDPANPRTALIVVGSGALWAVLLGVTLVPITNSLKGVSLIDSVTYTVGRIITLAPDSDFPLVHVPVWVDLFINLSALVMVLAVVYVLFRAPRGREMLHEEEEAKLRELLDKHGARDSLGYFALRRDKSVIFSPSGKAAVTYRVTGGVSLASADPIGDPEAWPGAIEQWLAEARSHAWVPGVVGASEEGGTVYSRFGFDALELGDEAVVEVDEFTLDGRAMRVIRQAYNRVKRAGYTTRIRRHEDIPSEEMDQLLRQADRWRDGETERGFSMALGRLGDDADGRCVMVECLDGEGRMRALLSFVPWGEEGLSLDLMRRDRESENGLVEFMVIDLLQRSKDAIAAKAGQGQKKKGKGRPNAADEAEQPAQEAVVEGDAPIVVRRVSLNFAMFRSVFERGSRLGAGPVLRLWRAVLVFFSRWWQIESLYRANAKFRPIWEPRFVLFEKSSMVPRIGLAYARAEGFLEVPSASALFGRRHQRALTSAEQPHKAVDAQEKVEV